MNVIEISTADLKPYENNPRNNERAIEAVKKSIQQFGFKVPIIIDSENVIVAGHTRFKAAQMLGLEKIPCVVANDLTADQAKAFRLIDNKTAELAEWDFEKLTAELTNFEISDFNFEIKDFVPTTTQKLEVGGEIDAENFDDEKFNCTCPKCGFKFNR